MARFAYDLLDVFTQTPFGGNGLAVFVDAAGVPEARMQSVARELNLSETTFVTAPQDPAHDARVRIFTPAHELPMAGHPTLGTAYALAIRRADRPKRLTLEEGVGPIPVEIEWRDDRPDRLTMDQPRPSFGARFEDRAALARLLSLEPGDLRSDLPVEVVSCGVPYLMVPLATLDAARRAVPRTDLWKRTFEGVEGDAVFAFCFETETDEAEVHARMFAPEIGVTEDPATGSANGPFGAYLMQHGALGGGEKTLSFGVEQGREMGRPSEIRVDIEGEPGAITRVRVGGSCVAMGEGVMEIPS